MLRRRSLQARLLVVGGHVQPRPDAFARLAFCLILERQMYVGGISYPRRMGYKLRGEYRIRSDPVQWALLREASERGELPAASVARSCQFLLAHALVGW